MATINVDYKGKDQKEIRKNIHSAYEAVRCVFDVEPKVINIAVHKTRKNFEKKLNRKTTGWEVANASYAGNIDILHPDSFEKESTHAKDDFVPILKHEFAHIFLDLLSKGHKIPRWLDEGFSSYVAGLKKKDVSLHIEEHFCEVLGSPKGWDEHAQRDAYAVSQLFVEYLIKTFSLERVLMLIASISKHYYFKKFEVAFKKIFGKSIEEAECNFVEQL